MNNSAYQQYRHVQMNTASPGQLIVMLYDGAIRFIGKAEAAAEARDAGAARTFTLRAQGILEELMASLRQDEAEFGPRLMSLYAYMHRRLVDANIRKDVRGLQEVRTLLEELRAAWRQVAPQTGQNGPNGTDSNTAVGAQA